MSAHDLMMWLVKYLPQISSCRQPQKKVGETQIERKGQTIYKHGVAQPTCCCLIQPYLNVDPFCSWLISSSDSNGSILHGQSHRYRRHMSTLLGFPAGASQQEWPQFILLSPRLLLSHPEIYSPQVSLTSALDSAHKPQLTYSRSRPLKPEWAAAVNWILSTWLEPRPPSMSG